MSLPPSRVTFFTVFTFSLFFLFLFVHLAHSSRSLKLVVYLIVFAPFFSPLLWIHQLGFKVPCGVENAKDIMVFLRLRPLTIIMLFVRCLSFVFLLFFPFFFILPFLFSRMRRLREKRKCRLHDCIYNNWLDVTRTIVANNIFKS